MRTILICLLFSTTFLSCSRDKDCPKPMEWVSDTIILENFRFSDYGQQSSGYCGLIIRGKIENTNSLVSFKAIEIPRDMPVGHSISYRGKLVVYPETYKCRDGMIDPVPGQEAPVEEYNYVYILEWEKK